MRTCVCGRACVCLCVYVWGVSQPAFPIIFERPRPRSPPHPRPSVFPVGRNAVRPHRRRHYRFPPGLGSGSAFPFPNLVHTSRAKQDQVTSSAANPVFLNLYHRTSKYTSHPRRDPNPHSAGCVVFFSECLYSRDHDRLRNSEVGSVVVAGAATRSNRVFRGSTVWICSSLCSQRVPPCDFKGSSREQTRVHFPPPPQRVGVIESPGRSPKIKTKCILATQCLPSLFPIVPMHSAQVECPSRVLFKPGCV